MLDKHLIFADGQAITASAVSDHKHNLKKARDFPLGEQMYAYAHASEAFVDASGTDSVCTVHLATSATADLGTPSNVLTLGTFVHATLLGTVLRAVIPPFITWLQYIGFNFVVTNGNFSAGKIKAYITPDPQLWKAHLGAVGPSF